MLSEQERPVLARWMQMVKVEEMQVSWLGGQFIWVELQCYWVQVI